MILETNRLILRELTPDDLHRLHPMLSDPDAMQHYPHPFSLDETRAWISRNLERYAADGFGLWAVIRREDGAFLGDCGITMQRIMGRPVPEIGYHIGREFTCCGYASEAARACLEYAFDTLGFDRVYCYMKHTNAASRRVAEKIGMAFETQYDDPVNEITAVYCVSAEEYSGGDRGVWL